MDESTKLEHFLNTHTKTTKLIKIIAVLLVFFVVIYIAFKQTDTSDLQISSKFLTAISKEYDKNNILSSNKIEDNYIATANSKLTTAGINIIDSKNELISNYSTANILATKSFELNDYEVATLINLYLTQESSDSIFSLCELDLKETSNANIFETTAIFSIDIGTFLTTYTDTSSTTAGKIYFKVQGKSQVLAYNYIFDHIDIQINELNDDENMTVIETINSILYTDSNNLEKEFSNIICDFINGFLNKTSTFLELKNGCYSFELVTE